MNEEVADERHGAMATTNFAAGCARYRALCGEYWATDREETYPSEFVRVVLTQAGWLGAMIPEAYGGAGLGLPEASVIFKEINRSGGAAGACHAQMYMMGTLLRHGSEEQRQRWLRR